MPLAAQRLAEAELPKVMSAEMRAQMIADSIGMVSQGDYRKRVYDTALEQIRIVEALQPPPGRFMA